MTYNLEALARARVEKHKRMHPTDQEIQQHFVKMTTGGGEDADDGGVDEISPGEGCATVCKDTLFPQVPWHLDKADVTTIIEMRKCIRLTSFAKELVSLPSMIDCESAVARGLQHTAQKKETYTQHTQEYTDNTHETSNSDDCGSATD